jgi:hypothetical protein
MEEELPDTAGASQHVPTVNFHLTSVYDHSVYEAFSRPVQRLLPCQGALERLMDLICQNCAFDKAFLFHIPTKLYIATDSSPVDSKTQQICSDFVDLCVDFGGLYAPTGPAEADDGKHPATSKVVMASGTTIAHWEMDECVRSSRRRVAAKRTAQAALAHRHAPAPIPRNARGTHRVQCEPVPGEPAQNASARGWRRLSHDFSKYTGACAALGFNRRGHCSITCLIRTSAIQAGGRFFKVWGEEYKAGWALIAGGCTDACGECWNRACCYNETTTGWLIHTLLTRFQKPTSSDGYHVWPNGCWKGGCWNCGIGNAGGWAMYIDTSYCG